MEMIGTKIYNYEGDFGVSLKFILKGDLLPTDVIKFGIKANVHDDNFIVDKTLNLTEEDGKFSFKFKLTKEDSDKLKEGIYVYGIKQYRGEELLNTICGEAEFEVIKGA